ncbi:hypothetical protein A3K34_00395 [candidate division WWE3 bacterium RIFOXYC1_FULL_40_10]|uniref:Uncharacterized protein n=1 Tax=candidate division WWE3 bacterium RIFOXYA2_FULL_46_9 TaxID=1802636 RepID=A0A1F4W1G1_UNCKA|nr:MAG: hypothetical protein A3K58_00395 [candidate division WWE3 bacterium RIFOXYB1_FULL_40_22]OGC61347.1 MAG: hypothetical protein A3K37_00395 [candidate division WWE3 bacterium RIFOXYA1_FULL_40_11]OGC63257.1 MAG: hypothetical protein A2264_01055 [candidate division WWE3 bacterium RIFOXYA2_FULL_46_9]OGC65337.1 MAG: hypothetical protein A2326_04680 [candidate division WWE3 bacterium RIFOXYB2_FULL_41_6]OGC65730.1 MAG: hypothetical protein A3K34_00395 [candidate division WWE3 bacterium RIFOXYC1_
MYFHNNYSVYPCNPRDNPLTKAFFFFRDRTALSPDKAIKMDRYDWMETGYRSGDPNKFIQLMPFIKEVSGKYYVDAKEFQPWYENKVKMGNKIGITLIIGLIAFVLLIVLLGILEIL